MVNSGTAYWVSRTLGWDSDTFWTNTGVYIMGGKCGQVDLCVILSGGNVEQSNTRGPDRVNRCCGKQESGR